MITPNDIDLDTSSLLDKIPDDHVAFYFRASADDSKDFAYARGDLDDMAEALSNIMDQSGEICSVIQGAVAKYLTE